MTKNFEVNSMDVTESNELTNERTNILTGEQEGESDIPLGINAGGIMSKCTSYASDKPNTCI